MKGTNTTRKMKPARTAARKTEGGSIDTAPMDGTEILLWGAEDGENNFGWWIGSFLYGEWNVSGRNVHNPTRWHRLPRPLTER